MSRSGEHVAGVDGCPGGWAVVRAQLVEGTLQNLTTEKVDSVSDLVHQLRSGELAALAIDMPIGILNTHPRPADVAARALLGPRRSSVFPTPLRVTLEAADYGQACELSRERCGKALSKQAWHLLPKIRELDRLIQPSDQSRVVEAHPECGFVVLAGGRPLEHPKAKSAGRQVRLQLLRAHLGDTETEAVSSSRVAPLVDLIDAAVLAITAARVAAGTETRLGGDLDPTGLRCEIVF